MQKIVLKDSSLEFAICISSSVKCIFMSFACFLIDCLLRLSIYTRYECTQKIHIKTTMTYHYILIRMAKIRVTTPSVVDEEMENLDHSGWWEWEMVQSLWKTAYGFFKLNIQFLYDTAIILLGICPREMKTCVHIHKNNKLYTNV